MPVPRRSRVEGSGVGLGLFYVPPTAHSEPTEVLIECKAAAFSGTITFLPLSAVLIETEPYDTPEPKSLKMSTAP